MSSVMGVGKFHVATRPTHAPAAPRVSTQWLNIDLAMRSITVAIGCATHAGLHGLADKLLALQMEAMQARDKA